MRNIILFLIIGTLLTLLLTAVCSTVCAALIILCAKLISPKVLTALPFSVIGGIILSFFFYGKMMKKIMNKCGLEPAVKNKKTSKN